MRRRAHQRQTITVHHNILLECEHLRHTSRTHPHITSHAPCLILRLVHYRARHRQTISIHQPILFGCKRLPNTSWPHQRTTSCAPCLILRWCTAGRASIKQSSSITTSFLSARACATHHGLISTPPLVPYPSFSGWCSAGRASARRCPSIEPLLVCKRLHNTAQTHQHTTSRALCRVLRLVQRRACQCQTVSGVYRNPYLSASACTTQHRPISTPPLVPYAGFSGWCSAGCTSARRSLSITTSFFPASACTTHHGPIRTTPLVPYVSFSGWCTAGSTSARQSPSITTSFLSASA